MSSLYSLWIFKKTVQIIQGINRWLKKFLYNTSMFYYLADLVLYSEAVYDIVGFAFWADEMQKILSLYMYTL